MLRTWWKKWNNQRNQQGPRGRSPAFRRPRRLWFEVLEARTVPANVLLLADALGAGTSSLQTALTNAGHSVTTVAPEHSWDGTNPPLAGFQTVIHLNGATFFAPLPVAAQTALESYVNGGGGFISYQWDGYERVVGQQVDMPNLVLRLWATAQSDNAGGGDMTWTTVGGQESHPVLAGIPSPFTFFADGHDAGDPVAYGSQPSTILMTSPSGGPAVIVREFGSGKVVNFSVAANYLTQLSLLDVNILNLAVNAVNWTTGSSGTNPVTNLTTGETFATIQAAIDDADTVAGNVIQAAAGTYAENVSIYKAITLQGETGIAGDVVIDPAGGNGITVSVAGVTIQNLTVTGAVDGISASAFAGALTLNNVSASNNTDDGVDASSIGNLFFTALIANNNLGDGVQGISVGMVSFLNVIASGNDPGVCLNGFVSFADVGGVYNTNAQEGVKLLNGGTVDLNGTTTSSNGSHGIKLNSVGVVDITSTTAQLNGGEGLDVLNAGGVTVDPSSFSFNNANGILLVNIGNVVLLDVTASSNGFDGIHVDGAPSVTMTNVVADGNGTSGGGDGFDGSNIPGFVDVDGGSFSANSGNGFILVSDFSTLTIDGGVYDNNTANGIHVDGNQFGSTAVLTNVGPDGNGGDGAFVIELLQLDLVGGTYNGNTGDGASLDDIFTINVSAAQFSGNGDNGLRLFGGPGVDDLFRIATVLSSQFIGNTGAGIFADGDTNPDDCDGDTVILIGTLATNGNQLEGNGVGIDVWGGCVVAMFNDIGTFNGGVGNTVGVRINDHDGFLEMRCNQIQGNGQGAVNPGGFPTIDAILNWWGSASGPSGQGSGTGDSVTGGVNFAPWFTNPTCTNLNADPVLLPDGTLFVPGTAANDLITVSEKGTQIEVKINNRPAFLFTKALVTDHVVIYGLDGSDKITVNGKIKSEIHGGNGADNITGGTAKDIIWGDNGADFLQGREGDDVLVGGHGADRASGGSGMDILFGGEFCRGLRHSDGMGGFQAYDYDTLCAISLAFKGGVCDPDLAGGLEDDMDDDHQDRLTGGANADWFLGNITGGSMPFDILTDFLAGTDKRTSFLGGA